MAGYVYTVSANNNNATYSVVLKPYLDGSDHCIATIEALPHPSTGVNMTEPDKIIVNNATNGTSHINCTLQIKDTTNLYTSSYTADDDRAIADGVVTTQDEDGGAAAQGDGAVLAQLTEGRVNDLLARIVANWEGIITGGSGGPAVATKNCPIKNIFLRITV